MRTVRLSLITLLVIMSIGLIAWMGVWSYELGYHAGKLAASYFCTESHFGAHAGDVGPK